MSIFLMYSISVNVLLNFVKDMLKIYKFLLFLMETLLQRAIILSQCRNWFLSFMPYAKFFFKYKLQVNYLHLIFIRCHRTFDQEIHMRLGPDLVLVITRFPKRNQTEDYTPTSKGFQIVC